MAKIYQQVEQIFKFRILSNEEIPAYLARMSRMGKIDEIAKHEMLALILKRLGEIEDFEDVPNYPYPVEVTVVEHSPSTYTLADLGVEIGGDGSDGELHVNDSTIEKQKVEGKEEVAKFVCPDCDMVAKSQLGLISHSRKHKKVI